jgi:hypothetical protein
MLPLQNGGNQGQLASAGRAPAVAAGSRRRRSPCRAASLLQRANHLYGLRELGAPGHSLRRCLDAIARARARCATRVACKRPGARRTERQFSAVTAPAAPPSRRENTAAVSVARCRASARCSRALSVSSVRQVRPALAARGAPPCMTRPRPNYFSATLRFACEQSAADKPQSAD